jgi:sortase A
MKPMHLPRRWSAVLAVMVLAACGASSTAESIATTTLPATSTTTTTTSSTTTSTTSTTSTTTTVPPLPVPEPPPNPRAPEPRIELGTLRVPTLELDTTLLRGVSLTVLDQGPGHWPGTAEPGGWGNTVISAHRTTHGAPFRHLDRLEVGDEVHVDADGTTHTYVVTGSEIVNPDALWIIAQKPGRTLTMFACHPPGSVAQRIVVYGELRT